ncbi:MAG: OmpA family protein [Bacteroidota bacterium]
MSFDPLHSKQRSLFPGQEIEPEDDDSWQVSYLDIITILLAFLIILLSYSTLKKEDVYSVSRLFNPSTEQAEFITTPIGNIQTELEALLYEDIASGQVQIVRDLNDLRLRFSSDVLYNSGSTDLSGDSEALLERVSDALRQVRYNDFLIDIEGHTDDAPISSASYPSNWELSTARASNVVKNFLDAGFSKERLKASGYADSRPLVPNRTDEGSPIQDNRTQNRRVDVRLYYTTPQPDSLVEEVPPPSSALAEQLNAVAEESNSEPPTTGEETLQAPLNETVTTESVGPNPDSAFYATVPSENESTQVAPTEPPAAEVGADTPQSPSAPTSEPDTPEQKSDVPEKPVKSSSAFSRSSCSYYIQIGNYEALQSSMDAADNASQQTGYDMEITYNNRFFSVRTTAWPTVSQALTAQQNVSEVIPGSLAEVLSNCGNSSRSFTPAPIQYRIQLGFFRNRANAQRFVEDLKTSYGINAQISEQSTQAYSVLSETYRSRSTALERLQYARNQRVSSNVFLRYDDTSITTYRFTSRVLVALVPTRSEANELAETITRQTRVKVSVQQFEEGSYGVLTESVTNWGETLSRYNEITNRGLNLSEISFLLSYE